MNLLYELRTVGEKVWQVNTESVIASVLLFKEEEQHQEVMEDMRQVEWNVIHVPPIVLRATSWTDELED